MSAVVEATISRAAGPHTVMFRNSTSSGRPAPIGTRWAAPTALRGPGPPAARGPPAGAAFCPAGPSCGRAARESAGTN
eukprot:8005984-Lingulodinium_polyedra.AAC.1